MSDAARLHVTDARGQRDYAIDRPLFVIGRRASADLQIISADVSREHAEIVHEDGRYVLRDRASRYGTFVNGEPVTERVLQHGDRIRVGRTESTAVVFMTRSEDSSGFYEAGSDVNDLRQMAAILDGLRALGSGRVLDEVLALVMDSALEVSRAERGFIMLANGAGELEFRIARASGRTPLPGTSFATSESIPRQVFGSGESAMVNFLDDDVRASHEKTIERGIRYALCMPLLVLPVQSADAPEGGRRVIGVLYLDGRGRSALPSAATRSTLEAFGTQAALAIESARLYTAAAEKARIERDLRIAADIQRALLPAPLFESADVELAADSRPSRLVGGDFFDYLDLGERGVRFVLGDVAGKGPPAALLAVAVQSHFEAQAIVAADPADAMARVNAALLRRPIEARFATMFCGAVDGGGRLRYCNAGHEPPLLVRRAGEAWLEAGGPVVGLLPDASYQSETVVLEPGDLVVVFSDGLTEARNRAGEEFGQARIVDAVRARHGRRPEEVLEHLMQIVRQFAEGAAPDDDQTVLVLRYRGAAGDGTAAAG